VLRSTHAGSVALLDGSSPAPQCTALPPTALSVFALSVQMPKIEKQRIRLHAPAVKLKHRSSTGGGAAAAAAAAASSGGWQQAGAARSKKGGQKQSKSDEIEVTDEDLEGLDLTSAANESEASKRAALADALKELIAMGSDSDEDEDGESDAEDAASANEAMEGDVRKPMKGQLQVKPQQALAKAPSFQVGATPSPAAAAPALLFAPSAPARSVPAGTAANSAADNAGPPVPGKIQPTKQDKRTQRHDRLMSRLALPGSATASATIHKRNKHGSFSSMVKMATELWANVLTPTQQNARTLLAQKAAARAAAGGGQDVLLLSDEGDRARLEQLQHTVRVRAPSASAASTPNPAAAAASSASAAAAASAPVAAAPPHTSSATPAHRVLSKAARQRQHSSELAQFTAVLHHPQFQASPLHALQMHLTNSQAIKRLQEEADGIAEPAQEQRSKVSGSTKKKQKKALQRRQQILQQAQMQD
jgi:hypothetical protein